MADHSTSHTLSDELGLAKKKDKKKKSSADRLLEGIGKQLNMNMKKKAQSFNIPKKDK